MITYTLDASNTILAVGGDWNNFAQSNGGTRIVHDAVVGTSLFEHVQGAEITTIYRALFDRVREEATTVTFVYRCDAPACRRRMKMTASPLPDKSVFVTSEILSEEARPPVPVMDSAVPRNDEQLTICCICGKVKSDAGEWVEVEVECERRGLLEHGALPRLSHGYCPTCLDEQKRLIGHAN